MLSTGLSTHTLEEDVVSSFVCLAFVVVDAFGLISGQPFGLTLAQTLVMHYLRLPRAAYKCREFAVASHCKSLSSSSSSLSSSPP